MYEEVDQEKTSSSEYTTDEEWEEEQRLTRAEWEKERVKLILIYIGLLKFSF